MKRKTNKSSFSRCPRVIPMNKKNNSLSIYERVSNSEIANISNACRGICQQLNIWSIHYENEQGTCNQRDGDACSLVVVDR